MKALLLSFLLLTGALCKAQVDTTSPYITIGRSWQHTSTIIARDTTMPYLSEITTLHSYNTEPERDYDTMYVYDHLRYMKKVSGDSSEKYRRQVNRYIGMWNKDNNSISINKVMKAQMDYWYWQGQEDLLYNIIYQPQSDGRESMDSRK